MSNLPNVQITSASNTRIPSLASIYQAKKSGDHSVETLKQKFQTDIEHKIQYVQQQKVSTNAPIHNIVDDEDLKNYGRMRKHRVSNSSPKSLTQPNLESIYVQGKQNSQKKRNVIASPTQRPPLPPPLPPTLKSQNNETENAQPFSLTAAAKGSETLRKLEREKSFEDARNAVQSQIEKIFQKQNNPKQPDVMNPDTNQSPFLNRTNQLVRRHDAVIGMGTPTLPGIFPSKSLSNHVASSRRVPDSSDFRNQQHDIYTSSKGGRREPMPPPPPPLPPNIPSHSLDILQKRMMLDSSINRDHMRPNMSSLYAKHKSMDSLATTKIATPDTMDYLSPPTSPTRHNFSHSKVTISRNTDFDRHGIDEQLIGPSYHPKNVNDNILIRRDTNRHRQNRRDVKDMRRSVSHNSLAMRNNSNQTQLHHPLVQPNNLVPFKLHPSPAEEMQSRKYHPNSYQRASETHGYKSSRPIMTSSYPSDGGTTATVGPMSMFGDFSIDPLKKDLRMQFSHPDIHKGNI